MDKCFLTDIINNNCFLPGCVIYYFFNTCMKKAPFQHRKVNEKSSTSSIYKRGLLLGREEEIVQSPVMMTRYTHPLFMHKEVLVLHLLKKYFFSTRQDFFPREAEIGFYSTRSPYWTFSLPADDMQTSRNVIYFYYLFIIIQCSSGRVDKSAAL